MILIVDDNEYNLYALNILLGFLGYKNNTEANNGKTAIEKV